MQMTTTFNGKDPNRKHHLRKPQQLLENRKQRMRYQPPDGMSRIQQSIKKEVCLDNDVFDLVKCEVKPDFKEVTKSAWQTQKGFSVR